MCWVFKRWVALNRDLSRSVSWFSGADVCAASCETRRGGPRQLEPTSAFNHPPSKGVFSTFSRHWQGEKERRRNQMVNGLFERCLLWALVLQEKGSGDLGAQGTGKQFPHIQASGACGGYSFQSGCRRCVWLEKQHWPGWGGVCLQAGCV